MKKRGARRTRTLPCLCQDAESCRHYFTPSKTQGGALADFLTQFFGTVWFLNANATLFAGWLLINLGFVPGIPPFDPFPFGLLTMLVSLEAIFLSIIVLISQNRAAKLADLRSELDFQVNVQAEKEVTKILRMLGVIQRKMGVKNTNDRELVSMQADLDLTELERRAIAGRRKR